MKKYRKQIILKMRFVQVREKAKKIFKTSRLTSLLDTFKISDCDAIHNIEASIEATLLSIDDFILSRS